MNFKPTWHAQWQQQISDGGLLLLRLWLGQEFLYAAWQKLSGDWAPPDWFLQLDFPVWHQWLGPQLNWSAAGLAEWVLGLALLAGLYTRWAASGLLYITWVAAYTVHFDLGWAGWRAIETDDGLGFKVPLMMALMLLVLLGHGGGRWTLNTLYAHATHRP